MAAPENAIWQMVLNVLLGSALTVVLTLAGVALQISVQRREEERNQDSLHRQEVARSSKLPLYKEAIKLASECFHKKETLEDLKKMESIIFEILITSQKSVAMSALNMFEKAVETESGENMCSILEFTNSCHRDLYEYTYGAPESLGVTDAEVTKRLRNLQARVLGIGVGKTVYRLWLRSEKGANVAFSEDEWSQIKGSKRLDIFHILSSGRVVLGQNKTSVELDDGDVLIFYAYQRGATIVGVAEVVRQDGVTELNWKACSNIGQKWPSKPMPFAEDAASRKSLISCPDTRDSAKIEKQKITEETVQEINQIVLGLNTFSKR
jgi:hypothetical protein